MIHVLITNNQQIMHNKLALLLKTLNSVELTRTINNKTKTITATNKHHPNVVLINLQIPNINKIKTTRELTTHNVTILVLTTYTNNNTLLPTLRANTHNYLTKNTSTKKIETTIHTIHENRTHLDPTIQTRLVTLTVEQPTTPTPPTKLPNELTPRKTKMLALIATGLSNKKITTQLIINHTTVKTHINRIFNKTNARDQAQAVHYAYTHGLADPAQ